jgi:hypothetical protein
MKAFVRDFPARLTTAPALAKLQDSQSPTPIVANPKPANCSASSGTASC